MDQNQKTYVVEHMEEFLYDWCTREYMQMLLYLNHKSPLYVTNYQQIDSYQGKDLPKNQANQALLLEYIQQHHHQPFFHRLPLGVHRYEHNGSLTLATKQIPLSRVCLLDMRGDTQLSPADAQLFDVFVFGGILGDHPPRDRTAALRSASITMRHLGSLQFSTDSAVLVTKLIIEKQMPFDKICFVDEPEMMGKVEDGVQGSVQMDGFRYVTTDYDAQSETFRGGSSKVPLMHPYIMETLMFEDFDFGEMVLEPQ